MSQTIEAEVRNRPLEGHIITVAVCSADFPKKHYRVYRESGMFRAYEQLSPACKQLERYVGCTFFLGTIVEKLASTRHGL